MKNFKYFIAAACLGCVLTAGGLADAAIFNVTKEADTADGVCDADCSLREAVIAANALAGPDTINLPAGTYSIANALGTNCEDAAATGDFDITDSVSIFGAGAFATVISGENLDRVLDIFGSGDAMNPNVVGIVGVAILNGTSTGCMPAAANAGGGIRIENESEINVELLLSIVADNTTITNGGGISAGGSDASGFGLSVAASLIAGNFAAEEGGAIMVRSGQVALNTVIVDNNTAGTNGGAVSNDFDIDGTSDGIVVLNSTISNNSAFAGNGGGFASDGPVVMINSTVSGNGAGVHGGGIFSGNVVPNLRNVTITRNTADNDDNGSGDGGGIFIDAGAQGFNLRNSIVSGNVDNGGVSHPDCLDAGNHLVTEGFNILGDGAGCPNISHNVNGDRVGVNPLLGLLQDNGGFTQTHALLEGSPAIDAGNPSGCASGDNPNAGPFLTLDQRGNGFPRPQDGNGDNVFRCDIGAYEFLNVIACGDGVVEGAEECDDGNQNDNDDCLGTCLNNVCGDGFLNPEDEECDDGNLIAGDGCTQGCRLETGGPVCGNGIVEPGETCDDGNDIDGDGCDSFCRPGGVCGNGILDPGEECDDGNAVDDDGCSSSCVFDSGGTGLCGDGNVDPGEECDDGNQVNGDGCSDQCDFDSNPDLGCVEGDPSCLSGCGDGVPVAPEECDDGNGIDGDGCSAACVIETANYCSINPNNCVILLLGDGGCSLMPASDAPNRKVVPMLLLPAVLLMAALRLPSRGRLP